MTVNEYFEEIQRIRGEYKNKEKAFSQISNIYNQGTLETVEKAYDKTCGITLLEEIAVDLDGDEQAEVWKRLASLDRKPKVQDTKDIVSYVKLKK